MDGFIHGTGTDQGFGTGVFAGLAGISQSHFNRINAQMLGNHVQLGVQACGKTTAMGSDHPSDGLVGVHPVSVIPNSPHAIGLFH